jgi:tRNA(His) 5'-end guanylyltransferase
VKTKDGKLAEVQNAQTELIRKQQADLFLIVTFNSRISVLWRKTL